MKFSRFFFLLLHSIWNFGILARQAIYGYSFCIAGQKAFSLLSSNALRVFAINSVGDFVLWSGKALVVACTVFVGLDVIQVRFTEKYNSIVCVGSQCIDTLMKFIMQRKDGVHHNWVPLVLCGLFAYLISHTFVTVYEVSRYSLNKSDSFTYIREFIQSEMNKKNVHHSNR